ncbi:MAG: branched-chain amino acid ABC transporter substrate-binding protein [Alcaligenaceae bacterium]|nr:branched-chain amino acid ABC transporter substrate-binding protein [Alcaligenaceae bacterium SAGV5]MPS51464.1 branched-chain amino acid ABC transporter substrate-binding protein [Alcaligenaceae bacterium SAGV3]MPT59724.1 branched-chain amino acid ABC transporter substrate-binding protein [Alcaligenaceae bacterium]
MGGAAPAAWAQESIKIGVIQPLTGSVAYNGLTYVNGAKLAVERRNAAGGVLGKKVELVIEDGQCRPANSVNAAEKLIVRDKVVALTGAFCSSATAAVMPVAEKYKLPMLTGVSSKADLTEKGLQYFFRSAETDRLMSRTFSKILAQKLQLKTVAYIGVNDDWGRGGVEDFSKDLSALGVKTVMKEYFDHGATDFYTLLTKLRAAKPDGVFVAAETQDGSILVKQFKEFGIQTKIFGVGSWATSDFIGLTGDASEGIYAAVPYASSMPGERNQSFVQYYSAAYKEKPGKYGAAGYNALNIVMEAIARAGNTQADAIRDALRKTDYAAPNGHFKFTEKGEGYGFDVVLVQIQNREPKVVAQSPTERP